MEFTVNIELFPFFSYLYIINTNNMHNIIIYNVMQPTIAVLFYKDVPS